MGKTHLGGFIFGSDATEAFTHRGSLGGGKRQTKVEIQMNQEYFRFKGLRDPNLLLREGVFPFQKNMTTMLQTSPYNPEGIGTAPPDHQLTYRMIKTEAKLLKVIFEINGFRHLDSS